MNGCTFPMLVLGVILLDLAYIFWFVYGACKHDMLWISMASAQMYSEIAKAIIVSAGIVTSILASAMAPSSPIPHYLTSRTMLYLAAAIIFSVLLIMVLTRAVETAVGRELRKGEKRGTAISASELQGRLNPTEFGIALICGALAVGTFLLGILYLGRMGYILGTI